VCVHTHTHIYIGFNSDRPLRKGRFTAALPAAEETIHRSASNGLRRSASAASFRAGTLTPLLGVWLPAPMPTPRALPDHGALWPLAVGVEKTLGGIDV